ncbi:Uncharacterised protein [uncultured archaeon]|nr:Uncharacterised protein [uncultured archaeon]
MGKSIYVIALLSTIAVVLLVFFSIKAMEDSRYLQINQELNDLYFQSQLENVYSDFSDSNSGEYCPFVLAGINKTAKRLDSIWQDLYQYRERTALDEYVSTKKNFIVTNILLLQRIERAQKNCGYSVKPVIYFYDQDLYCGVACGVTENLLDQVQSDCNTARVFAFPMGIPEYEFADIVALRYNVSEPFSIIINDKKFAYPQKKEDLLKELGCVKSDINAA